MSDERDGQDEHPEGDPPGTAVGDDREIGEAATAPAAQPRESGKDTSA